MKRKIKASTEYIDYNVSVTFAGYTGAVEDLVVYAKVGATEDDIRYKVMDDYKDELLEGEVVAFDGDDGYTVEVSFAGYAGVSEEYEVYADDEADAIDQAIADAAYELDIESFEPIE